MAKGLANGKGDDDHVQWAADDDVYVPDARVTSLLSVPSAAGRRASSLGTLHHAGHSHWLTAAGHLITAIIGAGVLGLPNAVAWLGWAAGMACLVGFYVITLWTCTMLTDCYHVKGKRHTRYKWAVLHILGPRHAIVLSVCQNVNMFLSSIGYQIAAADSMRYIAQLICQLQGAKCPRVLQSQWQHTLIFGAVQVLMSQLPNLESAWWASAIGAAMSIGYSAIAAGLGASQAGNLLGTIGGRAAPPADKVFGIFNALGSIGFAYSTAIVLIEVEDTLREPPAAAVSMKKTLQLGLGTTFFFYVCVSVLGYLSLGNAAPDNVLLGFKDAPAAVNIVANAMVLVHMVSAFQVYSQPVFATIEDILIGFFPTLQFVGKRKEAGLRAVTRTAYVCVTTFVACLLPFFGAFTGLVGAATFFPTAVAYPILMYKKVVPCGPHKTRLMWFVFGLMGTVAFVATVGSIESIVHLASSFKLFGAR